MNLFSIFYQIQTNKNTSKKKIFFIKKTEKYILFIGSKVKYLKFVRALIFGSYFFIGITIL
ncbi:MAG: hypothetical protein EAZ20_01210 [Bacteroidetes bacterium]|nr:MAG: hypothetical protein EAZ20_01210 [Bacteroidota bacterium]